ncbi:MAG: hypothetical protein KDE35_15635 [Geminicoccaceae bacterium]|nr:hypothetical protein [Geminicoccaceae bacterium]
MTRRTGRTVYRLELRPEPGVRDPILALRSLLKIALRSFGLRAVLVEELRPASVDREGSPPDAKNGPG